MTVTGMILLIGGFLAGLLSCKYKITDYDNAILKIKSAVTWVVSRFTTIKEQEDKNEQNTDKKPNS